MKNANENTAKRRLPLWGRLCVILGTVILLLALLLLGVRLYFRLPHRDYYRASEKGFVIPGICDGFIAQGLDFDAESNSFLVTGYMKDGSASPVYLVDRDGALRKTVLLAKPDGTPYRGHAGGLSRVGNYLYVAGGEDGCLYVFDYAALLAAADEGSVAAAGTFSTAASEEDYLGVAFTCATGDYLIVGEFYRAESYPTPVSHHINTVAGDCNRALGLVYRIDPAAENGIDPAPVAALSLPDLVQGMCVSDGTIYLSSSWGLSRSHISLHDAEKLQRQSDITLLGYTLPLYALDSASLISDREIPPMSEEIIILDGRLYTMCESASNKYIFGKFTSGKWCYATDLAFFAE